MDFFEAVERRRSIRKYTEKKVPAEVVEKALDAALLAPNSSNLQTWEFYWVQSAEKKSALIEACLNQNAARTAQELVVVVAATKLFKRNNDEMIRRLRESAAKPFVVDYYAKEMRFLYGYHWLAPLKWLIYNIRGLFRPFARHPWSYRDVQEISVKSAALASQNFMMAITAQGFATCPMEGFDEARVKKILNLVCSDRVVMVISVGDMDAAKVWGPRVRFPKDWFVKRV